MSKTAPLTHAQTTTYVATRQRSLLFVCVLSLIFLLLLLLIVNSKPPAPIFVSSNQLSTHELKELQKLAKTLGDQPFYGANLNEIKSQVLSLSWVASVRVSRDWEKGIVIDALPKKAVANFGSEYLLDANGMPFKPANKAQLLNRQLANLHGDPKETEALMQKMQKLNTWYAPLNLVTQDVILTPRHTWLIRFDNGLRILVDYDRVDEKLYTLSHILADKKNKFDVKNIQVIDLRYKNGFSVAYKRT